MGLVLASAGVVFVVGLWNAWQRAEETRRWTETPCRVISSQVIPEQDKHNSTLKFRVQVRYEYEAASVKHTSERITRSDGPKSNRDDAEALREEFSPGQQTVCWVNPTDATMSVLRHGTRAALYTIWFPLLFVIGGLRMAWVAWRTR
jgi:hypothetical protein